MISQILYILDIQGLGDGASETATEILEEDISEVFQTLGETDCHSCWFFFFFIFWKMNVPEYFTSLTVVDVTLLQWWHSFLQSRQSSCNQNGISVSVVITCFLQRTWQKKQGRTCWAISGERGFAKHANAYILFEQSLLKFVGVY